MSGCSGVQPGKAVVIAIADRAVLVCAISTAGQAAEALFIHVLLAGVAGFGTVRRDRGRHDVCRCTGGQFRVEGALSASTPSPNEAKDASRLSRQK